MEGAEGIGGCGGKRSDPVPRQEPIGHDDELSEEPEELLQKNLHEISLYYIYIYIICVYVCMCVGMYVGMYLGMRYPTVPTSLFGFRDPGMCNIDINYLSLYTYLSI